MSEIRVARLDDLAADRLTPAEVNGTPIVLARLGESVYACGAVCAHQGGPLAEGRLSGTRLACPWHGWMYDIRTGECVMPARGARVPSYPVRIAAGEIWVSLP